MLKSLLVLSVLAFGYSTQAAQVFGLGPESGITSAVVQAQDCVRPNQVLIEKRCDSYNCYPVFIHRCNGLTVGWVEKVANGRDLKRGENGDYLLTVDPTQTAQSGLQDIAIETCDLDRADDLAQDARVSGSHHDLLNKAKLAYIALFHKNFRIQLLYNEWVMSGKCIGKIKILP